MTEPSETRDLTKQHYDGK